MSRGFSLVRERSLRLSDIDAVDGSSSAMDLGCCKGSSGPVLQLSFRRLMARNGPAVRAARLPLVGVERTPFRKTQMSESDPQQAFDLVVV